MFTVLYTTEAVQILHYWSDLVVLRHNREVVRSLPASRPLNGIPVDVRRFACGAICPEMRVPPGVNASDDRPTTCTSVLVYDTTTYTCRTDISLSQCRLSCDRRGGSPVRSLGSRSTTSLHCGKTDDAAVDIGFTWISSVKIPEGRADKLLMFIPLSLMCRQTPSLSLSVAPLVNTELASAERAANTATVDFDTGRLQPYMSAPEEQTSTLAHASRCTCSPDPDAQDGPRRRHAVTLR